MPFKGGSLERLIAGTFANEMISVSTSPDARMLAFAEGDIEICTVEGKDDPKTLPGTIYGDDATIDVAWSPDSKQIAYSVTGSEGEDGLYVIDKSGKNRRLLVRF
jgi:hypothetical protein